MVLVFVLLNFSKGAPVVRIGAWNKLKSWQITRTMDENHQRFLGIDAGVEGAEFNLPQLLAVNGEHGELIFEIGLSKTGN